MKKGFLLQLLFLLTGLVFFSDKEERFASFKKIKTSSAKESKRFL